MIIAALVLSIVALVLAVSAIGVVAYVYRSLKKLFGI